MDNSTDTVVQTDNVATVTTDTDTRFEGTETNSETTAKRPNVEQRDGKTFIDDTRYYTRDDINKIANNSKNEAISGVLRDLDVDSLDQVKTVISQLKNASGEDGTASLDVQALKQTVAKKEATVEELNSRVAELQTELLLKDHMTNLNNAMPEGWGSEQREGVMDLMKARNMFAVENGQFQLKAGDEFLTTDGETPDYNAAVETVGKSLGLKFSKKGVDVVNVDKGADDTAGSKIKAVDQSRLQSDTMYRSAYMNIRQYKPNLNRTDITNNMVMKEMSKS
tara:strand:+ start:46 stop:885 length:840 start_codon:yes stop_codon:yes gene_type:complete